MGCLRSLLSTTIILKQLPRSSQRNCNSSSSSGIWKSLWAEKSKPIHKATSRARLCFVFLPATKNVACGLDLRRCRFSQNYNYTFN